MGWGFGEDLLEASSGGLVHLVVDAFGLGSVAGVEVAVAAVTVTAGRFGAGRLGVFDWEQPAGWARR